MRCSYSWRHEAWVADLIHEGGEAGRRGKRYVLPEAACEWLEHRQRGNLPVPTLEFTLPGAEVEMAGVPAMTTKRTGRADVFWRWFFRVGLGYCCLTLAA